MTDNKKQFTIQNATINVATVEGEDYICLTDMVRNIGGSAVIEKWFRNKNTLEFLGVWEALHNPNFKTPEFEGFRNQAGTNRFVLSAKQWIDATGAIGVRARSGRYGGTYAHRDIAFEFGSWVSPEFKLMLIKEFQRLKSRELQLEQWDYRRFLTKVNYRLQTNAIQQSLLSDASLSKLQKSFVYAEEADVVNMALFGKTAKEWRDQNGRKSKSGTNLRDEATVEQLTVLSNLESMNSMFIAQRIPQPQRLMLLRNEATRQLRALFSLGTEQIAPKNLSAPRVADDGRT